MDNRMEIECHFSESRKFYYTTDIRTIFFFYGNDKNEERESVQKYKRKKRNKAVERLYGVTVWKKKPLPNNEDRGIR